MDADFQRRQPGRSVRYALSVWLMLCASHSAIAAGVLPAGGNFAAGSGKISSSASTLTVNQTTKNGIINWTGFSIGQGDSVRINNGSGATLNRVTGTSPSSIAGSLTSSGSTYLVNQNGIVVMPSGKVITGGTFVGSTRDTSNSAFMGGAANLEFTGTSSGTVTNQGSISASGNVVLIGKSATNGGNISAPNGTAGVVAGDDVVLQPSASGLQIQVKTGSGNSTTSGNIAAAQALIDAAGGNAYALAGNNRGQVRATGTKNINGHIWLTAPNGIAQVTGTIGARNANGSGGAIDVQGQTIDVSGTLDANDVAPKGNGGDITVGSHTVAATTVSGTLNARGGARGGNGGNVETSGEVLNATGIKVATTAPKGQTGNWTLDPYNVTISSASTSNGAPSSGTFTPSGNDSVLSVSDLQNALNTTNVTVTTGSGGSQTGDITVASAVAWSANVLTLDAWHSVNINSTISASGTAGLAIKTNDGGSGGTFNFSAGNVSFANAGESLTINDTAYTLVTPALTGTVTRTYDGTVAATLGQTNYMLTGVAAVDQSSVVLTVNGTPDSSPTSGTFSTKNAGSGLPVSVSGLGLIQPAGDHYFVSNTTISANIGTINQASLSVTANPESKIYGTTDPGLTYNVSGLQTGDTAASVVGGSLARAAGENAGSYAINQGSLFTTGNYSLAFTGNTLTITPATLTITADSETKVYGQSDPGLNYNISGLVNATVDGVVIDDTSGSAVGGGLARAAGENVGSYAITQGNLFTVGNYRIAFTGSTLSITPAALTVTADPQSKVYGNNDPVLTYGASGFVSSTIDGVAINDTAASALTGSLARAGGENVGSYAINQGNLAAGNYTIAFTGNSLGITPAPLTVNANAVTKLYGTPDNLTYSTLGLVNATLDGVAINDTPASVLTGSLARSAGENVGTYAVNQGNLAANGNYTVAFNGNSLSIIPATLTVTAISETKVYGTTDPGPNYSISGLVNATVDGVAIADTAGAVLGGSPVRAAGENAGVYAITQGSLFTTGNYSLAFTAGTLSIVPATLTVAADAKSKVYGSNDPALTYSASGFVNATVDGVAINDTASSVLTGGLTRAAGEKARSYAITQGSLAATGNYAIAYTGNSLTITPAAMTVTADAQSKTYGSADPVLTYSAAGFVNATADGIAINDMGASALTGGLARATGENVGTYAINQGSLAASNYAIAFTGSSLSINPAALTVTANPETKGYGTTDPVLTYSTSGLVNATVDGIAIDDTPASVFTGSLGRTAGENAGSYAINQGSLAASNNYTMAFSGNSLSISPATLTVTANSETKVYGTSDPGLAYGVSGLVNGVVDGVAISDTVASVLGGSLARAVGENAGSYAITRGSLFATGNYTIAFTGSSLSITPAALTVTADARSKVYGSNDPALTYGASGFVEAVIDGVAINDSAASVLTGSLARVAGESAGSYAINRGSLAATNYIISFTGNSLSIAPAALTVAAGAESKVYGSSDPALTYAASGLIHATVDGVSIYDTAASVLTGGLLRAAGENTGSYAINQGSLAANGNYTLSFSGNSLSITPATLAVTANYVTKVYGTPDPALSYGVSGLVNGIVDGVAINDTAGSVLSGGLARAAGENAGSYAINQGSLAASGNYNIVFTGNALNIAPAMLTIAANPETKLYGAPDPGLTFSASGLVNATVDGFAINDTVASVLGGSLARAAGENAGSYAINRGGLVTNGDYTIAFAGNSLSITPATLTVAADARTKTYGTDDPALTYGASGLANEVVDGVILNDTPASVLTGGLARVAGENVGSYAINQGSLAANSNYAIAFIGNSLSITPATLTVAANAETRVYGTSDPALAYGVSGLVNGVVADGTAITDTAASVLTGSLARMGTGTLTGEQIGGHAIAQGTLAANSDYTIAFTGNSLTITPATLTVTANSETKVYGKSDPVLAYGVTGLVNSIVDGVAINDSAASVLTGSLARAAGENAGSYAINQGSLAATSNYTIAFTGNALSITPATLTYVANSASSTSGSPLPLFSGTVTGFVNGDSLTSATTGNAVFATAATASSPVGSYAINGSGLTANNGNYIFVQAPGNATALTITSAVTASVTAVGADFAGANLSNDNLTSVNFSGADLAGANLSKTNLTDAILTNTDLTGANLHGATLTGATISTVSTYTLANLPLGTDWSGKNLSGMNLSGMDLAGYNLAGANLKGANLTGVNLIGADLAGANLSGATLFGANFTDADLKGANLQGAIFQ